MYNTYKSAVKWPLDDQKRRRLGALDLIQNHRLTPFRPFLRSPIHHRRPFLMYISACLCSSSRGGGGGDVACFSAAISNFPRVKQPYSRYICSPISKLCERALSLCADAPVSPSRDHAIYFQHLSGDSFCEHPRQ